VIRLYTWWNGMARQGRTGWTLVIVGTVYILYFLIARLFATGAPITTREWCYCVGMLILIMLGTINIRMAEMRARRQGTLPLIDPKLRSRK
jgi:xanthine/uracil/vitamin C permease (AzgA family)